MRRMEAVRLTDGRRAPVGQDRFPPTLVIRPAPGLDVRYATAAAGPVKLPGPLSAGGSLRPFA